MKKYLFSASCLCASGALLLSSVSLVRAQEPSPANPFANWANQLLRSSGLTANQQVVVQMVTYIIAAHQASERQREIADERARRAYQEMSQKKKQELKRKKVRYIAVDTEKDEHTAAGAKKTVMVWDTKTEKIANNQAYDVKSTPRKGTTAKFDNYSAEYVGSGS